MIDRLLDFLTGREAPALDERTDELQLSVAALLIEAERALRSIPEHDNVGNRTCSPKPVIPAFLEMPRHVRADMRPDFLGNLAAYAVEDSESDSAHGGEHGRPAQDATPSPAPIERRQRW